MTLSAHLADPVGHVRDLRPTDGPHTADSITAAAIQQLAHLYVDGDDE